MKRRQSEREFNPGDTGREKRAGNIEYKEKKEGGKFKVTPV